MRAIKGGATPPRLSIVVIMLASPDRDAPVDSGHAFPRQIPSAETMFAQLDIIAAAAILA